MPFCRDREFGCGWNGLLAAEASRWSVADGIPANQLGSGWLTALDAVGYSSAWRSPSKRAAYISAPLWKSFSQYLQRLSSAGNDLKGPPLPLATNSFGLEVISESGKTILLERSVLPRTFTGVAKSAAAEEAPSRTLSLKGRAGSNPAPGRSVNPWFMQ